MFIYINSVGIWSRLCKHDTQIPLSYFFAGGEEALPCGSSICVFCHIGFVFIKGKYPVFYYPLFREVCSLLIHVNESVDIHSLLPFKTW